MYKNKILFSNMSKNKEKFNDPEIEGKKEIKEKSDEPEKEKKGEFTWRPFAEKYGEKLRELKLRVIEGGEGKEKPPEGGEEKEKQPRELEEKFKEKPKPEEKPKEKKKTVEEWYEELKKEIEEGRLSRGDIEKYIEQWKEFKKRQKPGEPVPEEFEQNIVKVHFRLFGDIEAGKIKVPEKKARLIGEEDIIQLLKAAGIREEYLRETPRLGIEMMKEIVEKEITDEKVEALAKEKGLTVDEAREELQAKEIRKYLAERELIVRGIWGVKTKKGEKIWGVRRYTNLDGKCALGLLNLAGIDISKVKYVTPGDWEQGAINLDTGNKEGFVFQIDIAEGEKPEFIQTVFFDHHGPKSDRNTSATKVVYETLTDLGLLKRSEEMYRLVKFATQVDNFAYPEMEKYFETSDRTVLGLQRFMSFEKLLEYFKAGRSPVEILSDEDLKHYGLIYEDPHTKKIINRSEEQKAIIESSKKKLDELKKEGKIIDTKYGKIVIDIGSELSGGQWAVAWKGYDGYLAYNYEEGQEGFVLALNRGRLKGLDLPQGQLVRDTMYVQLRGLEPLRLTLGDLIKAITKKDFKPEGKLKEFLYREKRERKKKENALRKEAEEAAEEAWKRVPTEIRERILLRKKEENLLRLIKKAKSDKEREKLKRELDNLIRTKKMFEEKLSAKKEIGKKEIEKILVPEELAKLRGKKIRGKKIISREEREKILKEEMEKIFKKEKKIKEIPRDEWEKFYKKIEKEAISPIVEIFKVINEKRSEYLKQENLQELIDSLKEDPKYRGKEPSELETIAKKMIDDRISDLKKRYAEKLLIEEMLKRGLI